MHDPKRKAERGYIDPKSYVRYDGSEVLKGADWTKRKYELGYRCGYRCEYVYAFDEAPSSDRRCREAAHDPHHIVPRWKRRDDRLSNLMALCRMHHKQIDGRKIGGRK